MHRMQTEGIHVHNGGAGCTGRAEGNPSQAFVDLCSPDDDQVGGPSFGGGGRMGKNRWWRIHGVTWRGILD